jgi:hypothetical protein
VGGSVFAQDEKPIEQANEVEPGCVIWPLELKPVPVVFDADAYYREQIKFTSREAMNPFGPNSEARYHLDKDLPQSQVLTTGTIFTFDHLRHSVRN